MNGIIRKKKRNFGSPMATAPGAGTLPPGTFMNMAGDVGPMREATPEALARAQAASRAIGSVPPQMTPRISQRGPMIPGPELQKPAGLPAHTGIGQLAKQAAMAKAQGLRHTGLGQKLKRKVAKYTTPNITWY